MARPLSRRVFSLLATGTACHSVFPQSSPARSNVAELDHANILSQAKAVLNRKVLPPPSQSFHSELEPNPTTAGLLQPHLDRSHAMALQEVSSSVAALAAGFLLTHDEVFRQRAVALAQPWLLDASTRLQPSFDGAGCLAGGSTGTPAGVMDLVPLAELARAFSFLADALSTDQLPALLAWFADALHWLNDNKQALIARDTKDHRASAHLLLCSAIARFLRDENTLEACRKRFRTQTLRHQIRTDGVFPQEVSTPNPYRNTLLNFDLLGGSCQLLSSPFDLLWDYELIDGVGMRGVAAYLYPVIAHPERWGFPADAHFFRDLPGRRPALLFAGRAFSRPEYVEAWQTLPPDPPATLSESFPIRQPALWTARAPHGY